MAFLMLADGTSFYGESVGSNTHSVGEVVFNTSHLGYQEILTDPSYFGQLINFTSPHIGNTGINKQNYESQRIHALGALFRCFSTQVSHWLACDSLSNVLKQQHIPAITDIDTRALTLHLREHGSQMGCLVTDEAITPDEALVLARVKQQQVNDTALVTTKAAYVFAEPFGYQSHLVVIDCGIKAGILQALQSFPVKITVVPESISVPELLALKPDGVLLSNGPGDPRMCTSLIALTKHLLQQKLPLFGICLGHQVLALSAGAQIKKMKFGHHGANHPIQCVQTKTVFISSQNHSYVVDEPSLPTCFNITHVSLFDGTIAGLEHRDAPAFSFQGHPEANPGPKELGFLFNKFVQQVQHA